MRNSKVIVGFLAGIVSGIMVAQCLIVLSRRAGWNFGGEVFILPLIALLLYLGYSIGREQTAFENVEDAFEEGYREGMSDAKKKVPAGKR